MQHSENHISRLDFHHKYFLSFITDMFVCDCFTHILTFFILIDENLVFLFLET